MTYRLTVATMGVAGMAYFTSPLSALLGFLVLVGGPVCYCAYVSETAHLDRHSLPPAE